MFHSTGGPRSALEETRRRSATWFDPLLVDAFAVVARDGRFWDGLRDEGLDARVTALEPEARAITLDEERLDVIAAAFADMMDAKSSYTAGNSRRVT